jgi:hypothetical protein
MGRSNRILADLIWNQTDQLRPSLDGYLFGVLIAVGRSPLASNLPVVTRRLARKRSELLPALDPLCA